VGDRGLEVTRFTVVVPGDDLDQTWHNLLGHLKAVEPERVAR
jgi:hypothetical protein